jgi:hypothetical protein
MIKERIFFVTTLSLLSVGIVTIPLLIWLQYRMFDLVASYEGCIKLARDRKLVGDELSKMAYGLACLLTIGQFTIDLAHWVFAIKFWDLSLKLRASV